MFDLMMALVLYFWWLNWINIVQDLDILIFIKQLNLLFFIYMNILFFIFIICEYILFIIIGWTRCLLYFHKISCFSIFSSKFTTRIQSRCVHISFLVIIIIWTWCFLSFCKIFSFRRANKDSMFLLKRSFSLIGRRCRFILILLSF